MSAAAMSNWWQPVYPATFAEADPWHPQTKRVNAPKPNGPEGPCQTIVFYHTCGCKSCRNSVHVCSTRICSHRTSTLLLAGLPYACGSQNPRSEACWIEDIAKTEFIREVDTADRLDSFVTLPECTREDIIALTPAFAGSYSQTWVEEIYNHYQWRKASISDETSSQGAPFAPQEVNSRCVEAVQVNTQLQAQPEVQGEEFRDEVPQDEDEQKEEEIVRNEPRDEQLESTEVDEELQAEIRLFEVGDDESDVSDSENVEDGGEQSVDLGLDTKHEVEIIPLNDTAKDTGTYTEKCEAGDLDDVSDSLEASYILPNVQSDGENNAEDNIKSDKEDSSENDAEKDSEACTNIPLDSPKVSGIDSVGEAGYSHGPKGVPQSAATVGTTSYARNPTMSLIHETDDVTDDFIDFLLSTQETKPKEKTSMWTCFKFF
ncbi:hypothetical protein F5Y06DRAFT_307994 [Hypoxylon sp. FL0890]|nr:hypothetical protein F5Y06DRAFT_307994 [Hypoxylon sp. FL0890]